MTLMLLLGIFVAMILSGLPVAYAMISSSIIILLTRHDISAAVIPSQMLNGINEWTLLAVPLFLFSGNLMNEGGLTTRLVDAVQGVVGRVPGGLAHTAVGVNVFMAGMSGSDIADASATGSTMLPALKRAGYPAPFSAALIGGAAAMGPLIPPSIPLILYGLVTNVSVNRLFIAGAVPGLALALALMIYASVAARRNSFPRGPRIGPFEVLKRIVVASPGALLPLTVIGGILAGIFTPTEAAAVAGVVAILVGVFVYRELTPRRALRALTAAARDSASVLLVVAASSLFGLILTLYGGAEQLTSLLVAVAPNKWVLLATLNLGLLVVGAFFESTPVLVLVVPLLLPTLALYHVDLVQFGVVVVFNTLIGLIIPPGGLTMYLLCRLADIRVIDFMRASVPVVITMLFVLALLTYIPEISLWLPNTLHTR
jgi:tripartite ATP-independent transporter DctM subunit